ncbi:cupredoxin domain-containing protein [Candidatus Nitrosocosmicus arcticus]|uniref:Blue (Type 1) copper domain protein n=1 Tax=Candidatus Nitrosocosmicus arcticus TaxID=2035267 RepID=A0A557SU61_9ARCH|nr:cupredoxin domain-containing protein [Candidatus Nitrosocosmicus arcticus]TVP40136.1 blue (type 1) copper domain protein [Candidatus Nitrosocosmicus arcticus]
MTTHDETHITKTSPQRFMKGLVIIIGTLSFLGFITITHWHDTASIPPPVSAPPPAPAPATAPPGVASETASTGATTPSNAAAPASSGPSVTIPAGASTPGNPAYAPDTLTVTKGDVITVSNDDTVPHTATSGEGPQDPNAAKLFDTSIIMAGDTAQIDTASLEAGDYAYYCTVHPFMTGSITVQ